MKVIVIADTHGRKTWKKIVEQEADANHIIFLGDYFDAYDYAINGQMEIDNFNEIVEYKKANMDKVVLLIGNHDIHYMKGFPEEYSRHNWEYAKQIGVVIDQAMSEELLQMCYSHGKFIMTHAGVTKTWCKANKIEIKHLEDEQHLENELNDLFKRKPMAYKFTYGKNYSGYGDDVTQSPLWVRPNSLDDDIIDILVNNCVCVVGHTQVKNLHIAPRIIFCDCLGTTNEYLIIDNNEPRVGKV